MTTEQYYLNSKEDTLKRVFLVKDICHEFKEKTEEERHSKLMFEYAKYGVIFLTVEAAHLMSMLIDKLEEIEQLKKDKELTVKE